MAAAVFRVKRKRNETPADSFIISCKKSKLNENESIDTISGQFKFAATVVAKDDSVSKCVKEAVRREKLQREIKQHSYPDLLDRKRNNQKLKAISDRFKVISKKRAVKFEDLDTKTSKSGAISEETTPVDKCDDEFLKLYQLYDIVGEESDLKSSSTTKESKDSDVITCNGVPMVRERVKPNSSTATTAEDYVYDIYYLNKSGFDFNALDQILTIEAMTEEFICDDYRDNEEEEVYDDEEDENAENHWRNDYPDEDPHFIENQDVDYEYDDVRDGGFVVNDLGMSLAMQDKLTMDDEYSSDEEDHTYFNEPLQLEDAWAPQTSYEVYKKQNLKELNMEDN